jgi:hypothetical protein
MVDSAGTRGMLGLRDRQRAQMVSFRQKNDVGANTAGAVESKVVLVERRVLGKRARLPPLELVTGAPPPLYDASYTRPGTSVGMPAIHHCKCRNDMFSNGFLVHRKVQRTGFRC